MSSSALEGNSMLRDSPTFSLDSSSYIGFKEHCPAVLRNSVCGLWAVKVHLLQCYKWFVSLRVGEIIYRRRTTIAIYRSRTAINIYRSRTAINIDRSRIAIDNYSSRTAINAYRSRTDIKAYRSRRAINIYRVRTTINIYGVRKPWTTY